MVRVSYCAHEENQKYLTHKNKKIRLELPTCPSDDMSKINVLVGGSTPPEKKKDNGSYPLSKTVQRQTK